MISIRSVTKAVRLALYYGVASHLPSSTVPGGRIWRRTRFLLCRRILSSCGQNVNIEPRVFLGRGESIFIGSDSGIGEGGFVSRGTRIGRNVMIGPDVLILNNNHQTTDPDTPISKQGYTPTAPVTIEDDAWIGARVILLAGVTIGRGSVVGAGAVVSKEVPPFAIVVGNPARVIRHRDALPACHAQFVG